MTEPRQRRFVQVVALVVLLGAILPSVTYIGHWTIRGLETSTAIDGHANHCHGDSSCVNQAAYGIEWWTEGRDALILGSGPEWAQTAEGAPSPTEPVIAPLDPPPRYA